MLGMSAVVTREEQSAMTPAVKDMLPRVKKASEIEEMRISQTCVATLARSLVSALLNAGGCCSRHCEYVLQHFETLPKNKKEARASVRLLLYFSHLITLFEAPYTLRTAKEESDFGTFMSAFSTAAGTSRLFPPGEGEEVVPMLAGMPGSVQRRFLSTFCERSTSKSGRPWYVHWVAVFWADSHHAECATVSHARLC